MFQWQYCSYPVILYFALFKKAIMNKTALKAYVPKRLALPRFTNFVLIFNIYMLIYTVNN